MMISLVSKSSVGYNEGRRAWQLDEARLAQNCNANENEKKNENQNTKNEKNISKNEKQKTKNENEKEEISLQNKNSIYKLLFNY